MRRLRPVAALLICLLFLPMLPTPSAQAAPLWEPRAPLATGRSGHTATLLADGQVLVVGGTSAAPSAERYNPAANSWLASAPGAIRSYHSATRLGDGRVLVAGGLGQAGNADSTASTELYTPATNAWSAGPALNVARHAHTATLLPDGSVLVAGGSGGGGERSVELYHDPEQRKRCFAEAGHCLRGRFLAYWESHGGLAINGFPLSDEFEQVLDDGRPYTVQYFERVRLEYHPQNAAPHDVLLGQFGRRIYAER